MGFGISDEVLEKILAEPFMSYASVNHLSDMGSFKYYQRETVQHKSRQIVAESYPTTETSVENYKPANVALLYSVYNQVEKLKESIHDFWSEEFVSIIQQVAEYFENIIEIHSVTIVSTSEEDDKKARSYLFDGISECIYYFLTHNCLSKPQLRNIVNDSICLVKKWKIYDIPTGIAPKNAFFNYYIHRYELRQNEFHCCPHCGASIILGVKNCPNCFALLSTEPKKRTMRQGNHLEEDLHLTNISINESDCTLEVQISANEMAIIRNANEDLIRENQRLRSELEGKDVAIKAMKDYISNSPSNSKDSRKILIIGDIPLNIQEVQELSSQIGISPDLVDILDDFSKIKKAAGRIRNDDKYAGIIVGAIPHKVENLGNATSLATLFKGSGFPYCIEARTYQGELKITRESLKRALTDMMFHLLSQGIIRV